MNVSRLCRAIIEAPTAAAGDSVAGDGALPIKCCSPDSTAPRPPIPTLSLLTPRFEVVKTWILIDNQPGQIYTIQVKNHVNRDNATNFYVPQLDPRWAFRTTALRGREFPKVVLETGHDPTMVFDEKYPFLARDGLKFGTEFGGGSSGVIELNGTTWTLPLNKPRLCGGGSLLLAFGGPGHEIIINDQWYNVPFGGETKEVKTRDGKKYRIRLPDDQPEVMVLGELRTDCVT